MRTPDPCCSPGRRLQLESGPTVPRKTSPHVSPTGLIAGAARPTAEDTSGVDGGADIKHPSAHRPERELGFKSELRRTLTAPQERLRSSVREQQPPAEPLSRV